MDPSAKTVLREFFAGWNAGQLRPLPFAILFAIAMAGTYLFSFAYLAIFETTVTPDRMGGAGYEDGPLGLPLTRQGALWLAFTLLSLFALAGANVMAKRFRDMGIPGWLPVWMLAIMMIVLIGGGETIRFARDAFVFSVFLALLGVPTDRLEAWSGRSVPRDGGSSGPR